MHERRLTLSSLGLAVGLGLVASAMAPSASHAAPPADAGSEIDALRSELDRGIAGVRLDDRPAPYYAELRFVRAELLSPCPMRADSWCLDRDLMSDQRSGDSQGER